MFQYTPGCGYLPLQYSQAVLTFQLDLLQATFLVHVSANQTVRALSGPSDYYQIQQITLQLSEQCFVFFLIFFPNETISQLIQQLFIGQLNVHFEHTACFQEETAKFILAFCFVWIMRFFYHIIFSLKSLLFFVFFSPII